jgi:hypothetical protein
MEKNVTVTVKTKRGSLVTVRGDSPQEFIQNASAAIDAGMETIVKMLEDSIIFVDDAVGLVSSSLGATIVESTPQEASFAPVPPPSQGNGGGDTVVDRWGNKWTYGRADAPVCPNGPMVLKQGTNQSGKSYAGWFDPAGGPRWQGAKVPSDQQTAPKWGVKV